VNDPGYGNPYPISVMQLLSGYPFWLIKDGLPFGYPALEHSVTTDVAVIGGGISGALMGYYLAKAGIPAVIADRHTIGLGSTCGSTSLLQYEIDIPLSRLSQKIGKEKASRAYRVCAEAIDQLKDIGRDIGFEQIEDKKSLYYAAQRSHKNLIKEEYVARKEIGLEVELLSAREIKDSYGIVAPSAILSHKAAQTDAYALTHALHQYALQKGIQVYDRTLVEKIDHRSNDVVLHTNRGYTITARKLVFATGYETTQYIGKNMVSLKTTYAAVSEQMCSDTSFWKDEALIWNTGSPYLYLRTTPDRRIIAGGRDEDITRADYNHIQKMTAKLVKDISQVLPSISFRPEFSWAGVFANTEDGLPYIGTYEKMPHSYFALGFGGNGITFSAVAAEMIIGMIKEVHVNNSDIFSFDR